MTAVDDRVESEVATGPWAGDDGTGSSSHSRATALLVPVAVAGAAAAFFWWRGRTTAAAVLVVVVLAVTVGRALSPAFDRGFLRVLEAVGTGVGHVLRWILLGIMFVLVFIPAWFFQTVFRARPLGRPRGFDGRSWVPRSAMGRPGSPKRGYGSEPMKLPGARTPWPITAVFLLFLLVVGDLVLGTLMTATGVLLPIDRGDLVGQIEQSLQRDMSQAPINQDPWAQQHGRDMAQFELQTNDYIPYIVRGQHDFSSPTVNVNDVERVSYVPEGAEGVEPLKVAFFGGSVMFGVGQRDEHTIPSAFARIAEENGVPIEVHNYGFPAWVAWQENQYFERLLASGEDYDLAVFLDGFNEFDVQMTDFSAEPTHHSANVVGGLISEFRDERATEPDTLDGLRELVDSYRRNSGVWRVVDTVRGRQATVPGTVGVEQGPPEAQAANALGIYQRSLAQTDDLAADHGVPVHYFWQPRAAGWDPSIIDQLPDQVTDLSHVFDGQLCFYDVVHTNERCAREMAQAMWDTLGPQLQQQAAAEGRTIPPVPVTDPAAQPPDPLPAGTAPAAAGGGD